MVDVQTFRILQQFGKSNCTNQKNGNIGEFLEGLYTHTLALNGIMALATSPLFHTVFPRGSLPSERQIGRSKFMQGNHIVNRTRNCTISTCANRVILSQCFSESLCTNQKKNSKLTGPSSLNFFLPSTTGCCRVWELVPSVRVRGSKLSASDWKR